MTKTKPSQSKQEERLGSSHRQRMTQYTRKRSTRSKRGYGYFYNTTFQRNFNVKIDTYMDKANLDAEEEKTNKELKDYQKVGHNYQEYKKIRCKGDHWDLYNNMWKAFELKY